MRLVRSLRRVSWLAVLLFSCGTVTANWHDWPDYEATFFVPDEICLVESITVPVAVQITTPMGLPFNGPARIWADHGKSPDGTDSYSDMELVDGVVKFDLAIEYRMWGKSGLLLGATTVEYGPRHDFGLKTIRIRTPEQILFDKRVLPVPADGLSRPVLTATVLDQFGDPLPGMPVTAHGQMSFVSEDFSIVEQSDNEGHVRFELPPSSRPGYGNVQLLAKGPVTAQGFPLFYGRSARWVNLRQRAERPVVRYPEKTREKFANYQWDPRTRTATVTWDMAWHHEMIIRVGDLFATLDARPIPMFPPARLKGGRVEVPYLFASQWL